MGNACTKCVCKKTKYNDKTEPPCQQVQSTINSERCSTNTLKEEQEEQDEEKEEDFNLKDCYNLTENEKKGINNFLSKDLYENELKFKRPTAEVECITDGVNTIVKQLMAAVGEKEPLIEISHQYLVGSMAEGTSSLEPDEFDFLVVLKHFSEPGAISFSSNLNKYSICHENMNLSMFNLRKGGPVHLDEKKRVKFACKFLSKLLWYTISSKPELFSVVTYHGKLTINSTTVCHHGPASVVKLLWEPKSGSSKSLEILVDITPCIEQKGIHSIIGSNTRQCIPDQYKSHILNDDTFMLIPIDQGISLTFNTYTNFEATFTTTEVKIVNSLSSHHKTCYMILKCCFNTIIHSIDPFSDNTIPGNFDRYGYQTMFSSYLIKTFLLRHVLRCKSAENGHHDTENCLFTCLLDITDDLKVGVSKVYVNGTFGFFQMPIKTRDTKEITSNVIDNVIQRLVQIGKEGYSEGCHEDFRKACHITSTNPIIQERADQLALDNVECHLLLKCKIHEMYNKQFF